LGTLDRRLESFDSARFPFLGTCVSKLPEIRIDRAASLADWRAANVEHAVDVSKEVFLRFNWDAPNLGAVREIIQKMFARQF